MSWLEAEMAEKVVALEAENDRLQKMVRYASDQGITFPPEFLPRIEAPVVVVDPDDGSETVVYDPDLQKSSKH